MANPYSNLDISDQQQQSGKKKGFNFRSFGFKRQVTYIVEGVSLISEFWLIGLIHQLGRQSVWYDGNVPGPTVGYLAAILFSLFYSARVCGSFFALAFSLTKKTVMITYIYLFSIAIVTFFEGFWSNAYYMILCRVIIGFCTGLVPLMSIMRIELIHLETELRYAKIKSKDDKINLTGTKKQFILTVEFVCSYFMIFLASLLYIHNWGTTIHICLLISLIVGLITLLFWIVFKFNEVSVNFMGNSRTTIQLLRSSGLNRTEDRTCL